MNLLNNILQDHVTLTQEQFKIIINTTTTINDN